MSDATPPPDDIAGLRAEVERLTTALELADEKLIVAQTRSHLASDATLSARIEALEGENARLHERLEDNHAFVSDPEAPGGMRRVEVEPGSIPDGIFCRDATISGLKDENARSRDEAKLEVNAILHWIDSSDSDRFPNPPGVAEGMSATEVWRLALDDLSIWLVEDIEQGRHRAAAPSSRKDPSHD